MTTALLLLHLCGSHAVYKAPYYDRAAQRFHVPASVLVAVGRIESLCTADADDGEGDLGEMQIRVGTLAARGHSKEELLRPRLNIWLAARHIRYWQDRCGDLAASLGIYRNSPNCKAGRHSKRAKDVFQLAEQASRPPES
jgi:soluble lytic murein transglycosylase-like protein